MDNKSFDNIFHIDEIKEKDAESSTKEAYAGYQGAGGIINEGVFQRIFKEAEAANGLDQKKSEIKTAIQQGIHIANFAKIELHNLEKKLDPKIILYVLLRTDYIPEGEQNHHGQMSDQQIFMEAARMLGDSEAIEKMKKTYPNINFEYKKAEPAEAPEIKEAA
jgi:hypothetical protein